MRSQWERKVPSSGMDRITINVYPFDCILSSLSAKMQKPRRINKELPNTPYNLIFSRTHVSYPEASFPSHEEKCLLPRLKRTMGRWGGLHSQGYGKEDTAASPCDWPQDTCGTPAPASSSLWPLAISGDWLASPVFMPLNLSVSLTAEINTFCEPRFNK